MELQIGIVKWFQDESKNANYGFIEHSRYGDLFFHKRNIAKGQDVNSFFEDTVVVFVAQPSSKHIGKYEAIQVTRIENVQDLSFLFDQFLNVLKKLESFTKRDKIQNALFGKINILFKNSTQSKISELLFNRYQNYINEELNSIIISEDYLKGVLKIGKSFFLNKFEIINDLIQINISIELAHKLWLDDYLANCQINYVASIFISQPQMPEIRRRVDGVIGESKTQKIFNRFSENDKIQIFGALYNQLDEKIKLGTITENEYVNVLKICKEYFQEGFNSISNLVAENISDELAYKLWLEGYFVSCQFNYVAQILFSDFDELSTHHLNRTFLEGRINKNIVNKILKRCSDNDKIKILECVHGILIDRIQNGNIIDEGYSNILKSLKIFCQDGCENVIKLIEENISVEFAYMYWLKGLLINCPIDHVSNSILSQTDEEKQKIFERCTESEKSNIFFKVLYSLEKIESEQDLETIKKFLELSKKYAPSLYQKLIDETIKRCSDYFKLNLWLDDFYEKLDFDAYKIFAITLSPINQKRFVKKVLKYIHEGLIVISIEELTSLNLLDFSTSQHLEQLDGSKLDYSTSIILNVISELNSQTVLQTRNDKNSAQNRIYDIIRRQINQPKEILQITGFFDECEGRSSISIDEIKDDAGTILERKIVYSRNEYNKAKNHPICDGRKAIDYQTKKPLLTEDKVEYWFCANQKCYKPSRRLHSSTEWEKYSLYDFLTILKVNFNESDLEIYLNIINKANRFLQHLNCKVCNHLLYPKGKSNYAFYGVNNFICKTDECTEFGKEIYLSHCLNGYCEREIDSRDSVKCKPIGGEDETYGWYVCNFCHACCSSEQLERRKRVYDNVRNSEYKGHLEGHRNLGILSCNKCGDQMDTINVNSEQYNKILSWFKLNKDKSNLIYKSGKNKDRWWFTIRQGDDNFEEFRKKLTNILLAGLYIPDYNVDKELQLIAEPKNIKDQVDNILKCKSCSNILDLSNDYEKARAIKKFHNVRFVQEKK